MLFTKEEVFPTVMLKYEREKGNDETFKTITTNTISSWIEDNLSAQSIAFLLVFDAKVRPEYEWKVRFSQWRCGAISSADALKQIYAELVEKGYAIKNGDKYFIRNDKRVPFPSWNEKKEENSTDAELEALIDAYTASKRGAR